MGFENGAVPEDWRPDMIVTLYNDKRESSEYKN